MASSDEGSEPKSGAADAVPGFEPDNMKLVAKKSETNSSFLRAARSGNLEKVLELLKNKTDINTSNANGLNALHLASKEGHVAIVQEVLKRGANVEAATKKGNTALHIASLAGQLEVIGILLDQGAKINIQSQNGFTPLYMAAQENHVEVVRFLLNRGAIQTLATEDGFTPLAVSLQQGHDKVVAVLLENDSGGKVHLPALHIAAKKDDVKAAKLLLENDHNVDKTSKTGSLANDTTKSGFTPLHIAAHYGNTNVAKLLIDKGADVNFKARNFIMPLHVSSKWGRGNMVTLLLDNGAIIDTQTRDGLTPLHCAARSGHEQVVDLLLERGSPVATKTKNGLSPLHMAIQGDHVDCARLLLLHKAPINDVTVDYLTPLHVAAHCGNVKTAKLLLDRKCEVNARALNGFTPLHIACKKNRIKVVELLLKYGAAIEATTESGLTPIHVAAFMGHMNIVIFLIQHGANPDFTTVRGETALHLAARANQTDIMRILLRNGAQVDARAREQQTPLHIASRLGNVDNVLLLLQHGASPDATMKDLSTPLHIAAKEGHDEVALILLEHGASQNLTTKKGFTTLHVAAKFGCIKVARLLLEKGADPNIEGRNGLTPIHVATHYNHINVALLLLEKGANPCVAAKNGYTALHIAAKKNQMDIATTLLQHGAKPNAESRNGFTPLHLATQENHTDMVSLLLEHDAETNCKAKNGLTPLHLAAQEDGVPVAEILVKYGSQIDSQTKAGYTPLHTACHFGQINMIRFLLERNANIDSRTKLGYTPLHHAAQQGHVLVVKLLLKYSASPNHTTNSGQTAMSIAQRLGYISVVEILRPVTDASVAQAPLDEKYKVIVPEIMQEAPMSDSEDEGSDDHTLPDQSFQYYLASDGNKVFQDDSVAPTKESRDLFSFDGHTRKRSMSSSMGPGIIQEELRYMRAEEDGVDGKKEIRAEVISRQYAGTVSSAAPPGSSPVVVRGDSSSSRPCSTYDVDNVIPSNTPSFSFLVSFLVDARGGAMRGCRHSGVRIVVPPNCALMPTRITCRLVKREKLLHPPPLMEGEALASRILEMGPVGAKLLGPMVIEVPHFASLHGEEREIAILRSDNGQTWMEHVLPPTDDTAQDFIQSQFDDLDNLEEFQLRRLVRITTVDFPQYFALVSRVRQDVSTIGCDGGVLSSKVIPQVQAVFPPASLNKTTKVGLQAQLVPPELVSKLLGNRVAVSPLVTIEPRRRKFHKPITLTIPLPKAAQKGMLNQYGGDMPNLRLLCSVSGIDTFSYLRGESACLDISSSNWKGGANPAVWEDITGSTPLTLVNDCVSFTTNVSARFWLMDCQNVNDSSKMAADLYQEVAAVPFMSKFVVFAKHHDVMEARLRVFCMTDDRLDKTLENQEHFIEVARSRDIEVLEDKPLFIEMGGNLIPVTKSGDQLYLVFHAFRENRLPFVIRIRDTSQEAKGRLAFMKEPRVARGEISQSPICNLNIRLPGRPSPVNGEPGDGGVLRNAPSQFSMEEHISKAELKLTDIADLLQADWIPLAEQLGVSDNEVTRIQSEYEYVSEQALVMLHQWVQKNENQATGNDLERALKQIGRDDVIASCMCNVKEVTDLAEKAVARVYLDASYDPLKDEIGSSNEFDSSRGSSMHRGQSLDVSYDEHDILKESESFADETGSEAGSVIEREEVDKKTREGFEYELEEVWDGTQWNVVRKTVHKISGVDAEETSEAAQGDEGALELAAEKPTREEAAPVQEAVPESGAVAADTFEKTEETVDLDEWEVVDDLPADEESKPMLEELDVTPQQLPYPEQATVLDDIVQAAAIVRAEEQREEQRGTSSRTEVQTEEEELEDGTSIRRRTTVTRQVRASGGESWGFPESEETVGTEIEEEILQLAPGIVEPFGSDLEQEMSVEDFEECLPDGTWVKRKVTTVVIKRKGSSAIELEKDLSRIEERHSDHSCDPVSIISQGRSLHSEEAAAAASVISDPVAEEIIIPEESSRPLREPRPQREVSLSSPEEEGDEELVERIKAIKAEAQYSMPEGFGTEAVEEPVVAVQISRKTEMEAPSSSSAFMEASVEDENLSGAMGGSSSSSEHFQLGLYPPQIAFQAASPMVQSPIDDAQDTQGSAEETPGAVDIVRVCQDAVTELEEEYKMEDTPVEDRTEDEDRVVAEDSSEAIIVFEDEVVIRGGRMDEDRAPADDKSEDRGTDEDDELTASPAVEAEMAGRISVDTSQQIFIEQMIEASRESSGLSPSESSGLSPSESRPTEFSVIVDRADDASSQSQSSSGFSRDLTIRPIDLSPLTPTPEPVEQKLPSLFDNAPSPRDQNEIDWPQEGVDEDDEVASASSLSEVAQVDDVGRSQESGDRGNEKSLEDSANIRTRHSVPEEVATSWDEELRRETEEGQEATSPVEQELEELEGTVPEGSSELGSETKRADE